MVAAFRAAAGPDRPSTSPAAAWAVDAAETAVDQFLVGARPAAMDAERRRAVARQHAAPRRSGRVSVALRPARGGGLRASPPARPQRSHRRNKLTWHRSVTPASPSGDKEDRRPTPPAAPSFRGRPHPSPLRHRRERPHARAGGPATTCCAVRPAGRPPSGQAARRWSPGGGSRSAALGFTAAVGLLGEAFRSGLAAIPRWVTARSAPPPGSSSARPAALDLRRRALRKLCRRRPGVALPGDGGGDLSRPQRLAWRGAGEHLGQMLLAVWTAGVAVAGAAAARPGTRLPAQ